MNTRTFALVLGLGFVVAAVAGFFPSPPAPDALPLTIEHGHGRALGLLPVNTPHNLVHLLFGVLGLAAYAGMFPARGYAQIVAVAYLALAVLGLLPATSTDVRVDSNLRRRCRASRHHRLRRRVLRLHGDGRRVPRSPAVTRRSLPVHFPTAAVHHNPIPSSTHRPVGSLEGAFHEEHGAASGSRRFVLRSGWRGRGTTAHAAAGSSSIKPTGSCRRLSHSVRWQGNSDWRFTHRLRRSRRTSSRTPVSFFCVHLRASLRPPKPRRSSPSSSAAVRSSSSSTRSAGNR